MRITLRGGGRGHGPRDALAGGARSTSSRPATSSRSWRRRAGFLGDAAEVRRSTACAILEENRVRLGKTLVSNVVGGALGLPGNVGACFRAHRQLRARGGHQRLRSWTYLYGKTHGLPILSIDNMQVIHRCQLPDDVVAGHQASFQLTRAFIKAKLPGCDGYYITTFFHPPVRKPDTALFPPILRPEILAAERSAGEHLLVYQPGPSEALTSALARAGVPCRIYGMRPGLTADVTEGAMTYRPFSETAFIADLASCRGVVAGGGFTLMGEAVFLGKPMLALPLAGQFEQVLNARYLEREGFGVCGEDVAQPGLIDRFLARIPACAAALARYTHDHNRGLLAAVDRFLASSRRR
ncbi:MAG: glycosyltransferase family protein [Kofleriaceae bacterium]